MMICVASSREWYSISDTVHVALLQILHGTHATGFWRKSLGGFCAKSNGASIRRPPVDFSNLRIHLLTLTTSFAPLCPSSSIRSVPASCAPDRHGVVDIIATHLHLNFQSLAPQNVQHASRIPRWSVFISQRKRLRNTSRRDSDGMASSAVLSDILDPNTASAWTTESRWLFSSTL